MSLRLVALMVAVIAVSGGVAFACGGGGGCDSGFDHSSCSQPSLQIEWKNPSSVHPSATYVGCVLTLTPTTLTAIVGGLVPGASCTLHAILANVGSNAVTLTETVSISEPKSCPKFAYSDNLPSSPPGLLGSGATFAFQAVISLGASAANACQGAHATISVTITGTESSKCQDVSSLGPVYVAVTPAWGCH
ncbi:MAG: hypothetical protein ACLP74_00615 [Thermoplasmata archaeon]